MVDLLRRISSGPKMRDQVTQTDDVCIVSADQQRGYDASLKKAVRLLRRVIKKSRTRRV